MQVVNQVLTGQLQLALRLSDLCTPVQRSGGLMYFVKPPQPQGLSRKDREKGTRRIVGLLQQLSVPLEL